MQALGIYIYIKNVVACYRVTPLFVCPRCLGVARPIAGRPATNVDVDGVYLDVESTFYYLCDMLLACFQSLLLCFIEKIQETYPY